MISTAATATTIATTITGGVVFSWDRAIGWRFSTNQDITVNSLGAYDYLLDGLSSPTDVGLWRASDQALIASVTVPAGTSGTLIDHFRFAPISPVVLTSGTEYRITAGVQGQLAVDRATASLASEINWIGNGAWAGSGTLSFPAHIPGPENADRWFGGNFTFSVPEPTAVLLLATGLVSLAWRVARDLKA
jgi:hypothetical protein